MENTGADKSLSEITDDFDDGLDNKIYLYGAVISVESIKEEPCDLENEQGSIHNCVSIKDENIDDLIVRAQKTKPGVHEYSGVKDENIDDLTVVAQETELVTDCTDDKKTVIDRGYIKQESCDTEGESGSFDKRVNIKDDIEDSKVVVIQGPGLTTNIKGNYLICCEGCGGEYDLYCLNCPMLICIFNSNNPKHNKVSRTLPKGFIDICKTPNGVGIVALKAIPKGVVFGPFEGLNSIKDDGVSKWRLKNKELAYTKDPKWLNWMQYVRRAGQNFLRNLTPFQYQDALYYRSDCLIGVGDELLVCWDSKSEENEQGTGDSYWTPQICERLDDTYACTLCCVGYKSKCHLEAHNFRCPKKGNRGDFCKKNIQCAFCKIYLDEKEYLDFHMDRCCESNREKYVAAVCSPEAVDNLELKNIYKCSLCVYSTSQKDKFGEHQLSHTDLRLYKCPQCPHRARTNYKLQKHLLTHAKSKRARFECEQCGEPFTNSYFFVTHQKREHSVSVYKCDKCVFETTIAHRLRRHLTTHRGAKRYSCKTCGKQFQTKETLYEHVRNLHNEKKNKYKCPKCEFESFYWASLKHHLLAVHSGVKRFKCPRCAFKTNYKKIIEHHLRYHVHHSVWESKYERKDDLEPFRCTLCPYRAKTKNYLKQHMLTHNNDRPFKCDVCPQAFKEKYSLAKHARCIHSEPTKKEYKCSKCEYSTHYKCCLTRHLRVHDGLKPFACTLCSHKAITNSLLKRHMTVHTDVKAFQCDLCPQMFKEKNSLVKHARYIHSVAGKSENGTKKREAKKKEYKCSKCKYSTYHKSCLNRHVARKHDNLKPFTCTLCPYKTITNYLLKRHLAVHTDDKTFKCDMCPKMFKQKATLTNHVRTIHSESEKKEYKCPQCPFETKYRKSLKYHMDRHNKSELFQCSECEFSTYNKRNFSRHQIRHERTGK